MWVTFHVVLNGNVPLKESLVHVHEMLAVTLGQQAFTLLTGPGQISVAAKEVLLGSKEPSALMLLI